MNRFRFRIMFLHAVQRLQSEVKWEGKLIAAQRVIDQRNAKTSRWRTW